jgi:hypothetical protein
MTPEGSPAPPLPRRALLTLALATLPAVCAAGGSAPAPGTAAPGAARGGTARAAGRGVTAAAPARKPAVTKGGGPVPLRPGKVMVGAYVGLEGLSQPESLALRRRQLGREQRILHGFYDWTDDLPHRLPGLDPIGSGGTATPMISWRGTRYDEINDGRFDELIATAARRLARHRRPTLLRWGWEMNTDWFPWSGQSNGRNTAGYVAAWRRLHRIFREQGADNVAWVWSPNWNSAPAEAWNHWRHYYPGDGYVDWVGVSGYNLDAESPGALFDGICADYGARKPVMITEVGAVDRGGSTKAEWMTAFAAWVRQNPAVGGVVWFDTDTHPGVTERFRVDSDPAALAAYRAMVRHPRFAG